MRERVSEITIGVHEYRLEGGNAEEAGLLLMKIVKKSGVIIQSMVKAEAESISGAGDGDEQASEQRVLDPGRAHLANLADALERMDPAADFAVWKGLCELAKKKRPNERFDRVVFKHDFDGDLMGGWELAKWVAREEFGEVFPALLGAGGSPGMMTL